MILTTENCQQNAWGCSTWYFQYIDKMKEFGLEKYRLEDNDDFTYNWKDEYYRVTNYEYWNIFTKLNYGCEFNVPLPKEFHNIFPDIELLRIIGNKEIKKLPDELRYLSKLTDFYCNDCGLEEVPKFLQSLNNIQLIDLSGNNIKNIPNNIQDMDKLQELYLIDNQIDVFPLGLFLIKGLDIWLEENYHIVVTEKITQELYLTGKDKITSSELKLLGKLRGDWHPKINFWRGYKYGIICGAIGVSAISFSLYKYYN